MIAQVVLTLFLSATPECPAGTVHQPPFCVEPAPIATVGYVGSGVERWRPWVEIYFKPWDVTRALRVMNCESKGDIWADNPYSDAMGLYQHRERYWAERTARWGWGGYSIWNVDANIAIASHLIYNTDQSWGHFACK